MCVRPIQIPRCAHGGRERTPREAVLDISGDGLKADEQTGPVGSHVTAGNNAEHCRRRPPGTTSMAGSPPLDPPVPLTVLRVDRNDEVAFEVVRYHRTSLRESVLGGHQCADAFSAENYVPISGLSLWMADRQRQLGCLFGVGEDWHRCHVHGQVRKCRAKFCHHPARRLQRRFADVNRDRTLGG